MNVQASPAKPAGSRERSLEEVKAEFMRRAGRLNPFEEISREDAETVMNALTDLDKDRWAREWSKIGHGYEEKADARAKAGASGKDLAELYMQAFDACRVGRYPTPTSPGKFQAYQDSLRMFRKAAKYFDPPL
jgi:esterase FrsA